MLAAGALLALAGPGVARASLPPQGLYEQCAPNSSELDCGARLREMSDAGFKYVLNYTAWYGSAEQVRNYADQADAAGIELIWPLNDRAWRDGTDLVDHYRYLGPDCHCSSNADFKQFALGLVKDHPATWGFYIGDEVIPSQENIAQVAALSSEVGQIAPGKPTLYVTLPRHDLEQQLAPFAPLADIAGTDYYPVGLDPDLSRMPGVASTTRRVAAQHGSGSALVMQAFSWSQYEPQGSTLFPTRAEMLRMRNLGIRHGDPNLILWYAYNDILDSADAKAHWQDLRAAAFAPHIKLSRVPSGCARSRFKPRVTVSTASRLRSARAELDG
jgi:hypothetical protein